MLAKAKENGPKRAAWSVVDCVFLSIGDPVRLHKEVGTDYFNFLITERVWVTYGGVNGGKLLS